MTEREQLIDKLMDVMDRDNATAFVDRVIAEALSNFDPEDRRVLGGKVTIDGIEHSDPDVIEKLEGR